MDTGATGGDIKATKCKKTREYWVKSPANAPSTEARDITETLLTPGKNYGKDSYTIDLTGAEATYWLGTESGLLGAFQFDGACTVGDGSCDVRSLSMGPGFCNLNSLKWLTEEPFTPTRMHEQRSKQSHKVGREEEGMSSNRPEQVALRECLEAHPDNDNLLYLTVSEATLQDINKWIGGGAKLSLAKTEFRKRERSKEDGSFMPHQKGPITSTFTADWFLQEGQGRELLGERMKKTAVRSQDQRRMLQANSHTFPTNAWIHRITQMRIRQMRPMQNLWIVEDRFRTEKELPEQTMGHIQHTCKALSAPHIDAHHQC
jgi:hypothetical protein